QGKVPRPMNCFFVYRREKQQELQMTMPGENNQNISVIIGDMWKNEPDDVKELYKQKAEQEKVIHSSLYPGYKYVPKRSGK
ncbi:sequence-specific DNA-binding high mobility group box protein, partial [Neoconidiobolus thromboides FSU 785]